MMTSDENESPTIINPTTTQTTSQCPCGLTREDLRAFTTTGSMTVQNGYCQAPDANGNPCGRRVADHPYQPQGSHIFLIFVDFSFFLNELFSVLSVSCS